MRFEAEQSALCERVRVAKGHPADRVCLEVPAHRLPAHFFVEIYGPGNASSSQCTRTRTRTRTCAQGRTHSRTHAHTQGHARIHGWPPPAVAIADAEIHSARRHGFVSIALVGGSGGRGGRGKGGKGAGRRRRRRGEEREKDLAIPKP